MEHHHPKVRRREKEWEVPIPEENKLRYYMLHTHFLNGLFKDTLAMKT
jgi:hypothetical protein